jgi:VCBS repeat-containing protein
VEPLEDRRLLAVTPEFLAGAVVGTLESSDLDEASGLVASRASSEVLWSHNDSGDAARLFALNTAGEHLGEYLFVDLDQIDWGQIDWEDIAIGPGPTAGADYLYVADMGDNLRRRDSIGIVRVIEPAVDAQQEPVDVELATFETFELAYPDGAHNAETLLVDPLTGDVVIVTKSDALNRVYRVTQAQLIADVVITMELVGATTWGDTSGGDGDTGAVGGDVSAAGDEIIIKSYEQVFFYERLPGTSIAEAIVDVSPETLPYTIEPKGEGITFDPTTGGYFTTGELVSGQDDVPLYFYERVVDESPPTAALAAPQDNGPLDGDPLDGHLLVHPPAEVRIGLSDHRLDDESVTSGTVLITRDGADFTAFGFSYDAALDVITLTPVGDVFGDGLYEIVLSGGASKIADASGNEMAATTLLIAVDSTLPPRPTATADAYQADQGEMLSVDAALGVLDNDADTGAEAIAVLVADVQHGSLTLSADGSFSYTPAAGFIGQDEFSYFVDTPLFDSTAATVTITVISGAPQATDDAHETNEDTPLIVDAAMGVLADDSDPQGDPLIAILVDDVNNGSLTLSGDGSFNYTPNANFFGSDTFTYRANDGQFESDATTVTITVLPVNDPPVAISEMYEVAINSTFDVAAPGVLANDDDIGGDPLTAELVNDVSTGQLTFNGDGSFSYIAPAEEGDVTFTYRAHDGDAFSDVVTVTLNVININFPPVANDDAYSVDEDGVLTVVAVAGVLDNDVDPNDDLLTATLVSDASNGSLQLNSDGSFTYTPEANFFGTDAFTYRAGDGEFTTAATTVTITVDPVNDAPVAVGENYEVAIDKPFNVAVPGVLANDSDVEGDPLSAELVDDVATGQLTFNSDGSFSYTAPATEGAVTFTYRAHDGAVFSNVVTVTLNVRDINFPPVASDDAYSVDEDNVLNVDAAAGVLDNDVDDNGDVLTATLVSDATDGTLQLNSTGSFTYTPDANFFGTDTFTYRAGDGEFQSDPATVIVTVVRQSPQASDDSYETAPGEAIVVDSALGVLANDSDPQNDTLTAVELSGPTNGILTLSPDGSFTYTPDQGFFGSDSFTYQAVDPLGYSSTATASIVVPGIFDFGDAPLPYPTTLADDGARHGLQGPTLGSQRDTESDGQPTASADGDGSDEDGVTFGSIMVGQLDASVTVNVQNSPAGAKLDAWIDFNGDGSWGGPGEQIFDNLSVVNADNVLSFDVPSWAASGTTYARFRLSTAGDLGVGGSAGDGEVEDYQVTIEPAAMAPDLFGEQHIISIWADGINSVFAADVDGDGDVDVLSASSSGNVNESVIAWYENDGNAGFTTHIISRDAFAARSVFAADVDGVGDIDVLSASFNDDKIAWYENDGSEVFTAHTISNAADGATSVFAVDVDGDGDIDVLSASAQDDRIVWYENNGRESFTVHTISSTADYARSVFAVDVDGDGDIDVLSASSSDDKIAWYENDGNEVFTAHTISNTADRAWSVFAADVDGDGDLDVLSASFHDDTIAWYENDGSGSFTAHTISTDADSAKSVFAADLDGDGDVDVLSASVSDDKIAWYENDSSGVFTAHTISTDAKFAVSVFAADVDGDGDVDVLSASQGDDKIAWYENVGSSAPTFDFGDAPAPYPTLLSDDGAYHVATGPTLGANRDGEANGQPTASADGDGSDEDGVIFGTIMVGQLDASVTVNAPTGAKLDAWIDFNGDGSWGGAGEHIFDNLNVINGGNALLFDVPSWAISGTTYARFRLSTEGDLGVGGVAADGEVEDYLVTIDPPAATSGEIGGENIISAVANGALSVFAADVDGDGDTDVLSASFADDKISWYENDGSENFTAHTISTDADKVYSVFAADVDGDGDIDVLSASHNDDTIAWYENDGNQIFTEHTISVAADGARSVFVADVDGDGDMDVLSASALDDTIAWYENDGSEGFTAHTISNTADNAKSVFAADVDGDGDMDVLSASHSDDKIAWYENDGSGGFTAHTISTAALAPISVFAADVDGDGDIDVLSASHDDDKIAWYENDGSEGFTAHTISVVADSPRSVFAADVDGDGDMDVLSASAFDDKIAWYENDGSENFTAHTVSTAADMAFGVFAADVDGDGDIDILSASIKNNTIAWYENVGGGGFTALDFGDAPAPYPTLLSDDGARHVATGPTLGSQRDAESDGQPSSPANGDGGDEDGVTFGPIMVGQLDAGVTVNVQNAPAGAKLDAWIDFNGDGNWGGAGEQIFDSHSVGNGNNALFFDVPSWAADGNTYVRFRLSTEGNLGVVGPAGDGEVEDYLLTINPPAAASGVFVGQNIISTNAKSARNVFAADVDGDGDMDVLSASSVDHRIAWYENDGREGFITHTISSSAKNAVNVHAADVDGDGDIDVLSASSGDNTIAWYENDGSQGFTVHTISIDARGAWSVFAADVDGDGDIDVLSASVTDDTIAWYENDGSEVFTAHTISSSADGAISVYAADLDGDGDLDVLSASRTDNKFRWYENDGSQGFTAHTIGSASGAKSVFAADVDGDGDVDVLGASIYGGGITWYENDGNAVFTAHSISSTAIRATSP